MVNGSDALKKIAGWPIMKEHFGTSTVDALLEIAREMDQLETVAEEMLTNIETRDGFPDAGDYNRWAEVVRGPLVFRDKETGTMLHLDENVVCEDRAKDYPPEP